jgi:hypothetical protein
MTRTCTCVTCPVHGKCKDCPIAEYSHNQGACMHCTKPDPSTQYPHFPPNGTVQNWPVTLWDIVAVQKKLDEVIALLKQIAEK